MIIKSLKIVNFRRFIGKQVVFKKGLNVIVGSNAIGKTTVLEAIYYLGITKSFKTSDESALINNNSEEFAIFANVERDGLVNDIKIKRMKNAKIVFLNNNPYKKVSEYLGTVLVVCFSNNDCVKLNGSSKDRRSLFEPLICQISNFYVNECNNYRKILNSRNALLKRLNFEKKESNTKLLEVMNSQLVKSGNKIINVRQKIVRKLNDEINEIYNEISGCNEKIELEYCSNTTEEKFLNQLRLNYEEELKRGHTEVGPHRDDIEFKINGIRAKGFASQGQKRSIALSLKLAEAEVINKISGEYPVFLLDDVMSELDPERQNCVLNHIKGIQSFITCCDPSQLLRLQKGKAFEMIEGSINEI